MRNLLLAVAASGIIRNAHYVTPNGKTIPERTLLVEEGSTNLCTRSQEMNQWSANNAGTTVTANAALAPDGTLSGDLVAGDGTLTSQGVYRTVTFTGDGVKCASMFVRRGASSINDFTIYDAVTGDHRQRIRVTWNGIVMASVVIQGGTGTVYAVELWPHGWYRVRWSAPDVVAANANNIIAYTGDTTAAAGSVYLWGGQAEDAVVPSSYIPTVATTVTRAADVLSIPFLAPPQELTVYIRGVDMGAGRGAGGPIWAMSDAPFTDPKLMINNNGTNDGRVYGSWNANFQMQRVVTIPPADRHFVAVAAAGSGVRDVYR